MRTIIAGCRDFTDYEFAHAMLTAHCDIQEISEVVCGCAPGADQLGKRWATERGLNVIEIPADWKKHGKAAGPIRNRLMAAAADALVAFWDGSSRGTAHMIEVARACGLLVNVYRIDKEPHDAIE